MACFEELGGYAVTPMLVSPCNPDKCCEGPPICYPCLSRCPKGQVMFCCEKPQNKCHRMSDCDGENCCSEIPTKTSCLPQPEMYKSCHPSHDYCCPTCHNSCKQVKTKYVIPCYRYEDGRIVNQPTILMRRACEVAVGARPRKKPFVSSSYSANPDGEIHRYISQDERGNCCYHFEKKNTEPESCHVCHSSPQCGEGVCATVAAPPKNCYYYRC